MSDIKKEELLDELVVLTRRMAELYLKGVVIIDGFDKKILLGNKEIFDGLFGKSSTRTARNIGQYDKFSTLYKDIEFCYLEAVNE